jgi:membrane associated rhomboid family serine protease
MIPFRDNIPSRTFPIINILIIVLNVLIFIFELSLSPRALSGLIASFGVVPAHVYSWPRMHEPVTDLVVPFFTSMFLHGGWLHLIGNMWYLWIFGDNVEDRLGHFRYLVFYLLCGIGAGLVQTFFSGNSRVPSIGASGAIAGVLGAYVVSYPLAKVLTLVPIFIFIQIIEIPAVIVLGFWFIMQFLSGTASLAVSSSANTGGVAWWAHVGGFIIGIVLLGIMARKPRYDYYSRY